MAVTNTSNGDPVPFTTSPANSASVSSNMFINLPEAGKSYELSFASIITSHCGGVSIYSERWTNITRCTGLLPYGIPLFGAYSIKFQIHGFASDLRDAFASVFLMN